jgi:hypothetical protein
MKKYVLFLILLSLSLNKTTIIDLENKGRTASKYIQNLPATPEIDYNESLHEKKANLEALPNTDVKFTWAQSIYANIPSFTVSNTQKTSLSYNMALDDCEDCLIPGFQTHTQNATEINCSYSNGKLSKKVDRQAGKGFKIKKEILSGNFLFRLTHKRVIEVSFFDYKNKFTDSRNLSDYITELYGRNIQDFYISSLFSYTVAMTLIFEDEILKYEYDDINDKLNFKRIEQINYKNLGVNIVDPVNADFINDSSLIIVMKNGIFLFSKLNEKWNVKFIHKVQHNERTIELNDIDGYIISKRYVKYVFIVKKYYGLLFIKLTNNAEEVFYYLEHPYVTSLEKRNNSRSDISTKLTIGVNVDNKKDEGNKEFYLEFYVDLEKLVSAKAIFLSRALISSQRIKASQTDYNSRVIMFLTDDAIYITPKNIYLVDMLPIYIYKDVNRYYSSSIGFLTVRAEDIIMFRLFRLENNAEEEIVTLFRNSQEEQYYKCNFEKQRNYLVTVSNVYYLSMFMKIYTVSVGSSQPGDDVKPDGGKCDSGKDKRKDDSERTDGGGDDREDSSSSHHGSDGVNAAFIVAIVVIGLVVAAFLTVIIYIKCKRRQAAVGSLLAA